MEKTCAAEKHRTIDNMWVGEKKGGEKEKKREKKKKGGGGGGGVVLRTERSPMVCWKELRRDG